MSVVASYISYSNKYGIVKNFINVQLHSQLQTHLHSVSTSTLRIQIRICTRIPHHFYIVSAALSYCLRISSISFFATYSHRLRIAFAPFSHRFPHCFRNMSALLFHCLFAHAQTYTQVQQRIFFCRSDTFFQI